MALREYLACVGSLLVSIGKRKEERRKCMMLKESMLVKRQFDIKTQSCRGTTRTIFLSYRTRLPKRPRHLSDTDTSAWRHRAFSPCASFLLEEGLASGFKRTPCRQGFRHRAHNNTNTLCLLFPTRAACLSINDLEFWRGKGTKSVPEGCAMPYSRDTIRYQNASSI